VYRKIFLCPGAAASRSLQYPTTVGTLHLHGLT